MVSRPGAARRTLCAELAAQFCTLSARMPPRALLHREYLWADTTCFDDASQAGAWHAILATHLIAALCVVGALGTAKVVFDSARAAGYASPCSTLRVLTDALLDANATSTLCALLLYVLHSLPRSLEVDLLVGRALHSLLREPTTSPIIAVYEVA